MQSRVIALAAMATILILAGLSRSGALGENAATRVSFQIATGDSAGSYFPVGQAIAGLISHPAGVDRCEAADVCGPTGLIISARTSEGAVDNLKEVNSGIVESGLAQDDTIREARNGSGAFAKSGKLTHVRVIGALFAEDVLLVAAIKSKIAKVSDLRGKRVSLGTDNSDTSVTAREILNAWHLPEWRLHAIHEANDVDVQMMQSGKLDAFFSVGGIPDPAIADLVSHGIAKLVPIDGTQRDWLVKAVLGLSSTTIPAGSYANTGAFSTVATRAIWIVRDSEPEGLIYGITRALFNLSNRAALAASYPSAREMSLDTAALNLPAPLHPGAARYYRETGKLAKTN